MCPTRPPVACISCGRGFEGYGGKCPACKRGGPVPTAGNKWRGHNPDDEIRGWYNQSRWRKFRDALIAYNPQCQHIWPDARGRCPHAATTVHHLLSPRTFPQGFTSFANCVAVCAECHSGTQGEKRGWTYVATRGHSGAVFEHMGVTSPLIR
jgi:hypothetical protein